MMSLHLRLMLVVFMGISMIQISTGDGSTWKSGPPDGLPELGKLSVDCGKEAMTIHLEFTAPYDGSVYSKSNGQSPRCIHVDPHSHVTEATFSIDYHSCGTRSDSQGKYYENTIVIQYDDVVIEAWDEAKKIRCEWHDGYEKSAFKMPITISDLDVVEMNFQGDDVDCWLEVQDGKGPWSAKVEGLVPLGSPLTLVVAIQDSEGQFDMRVKSCIAHDGHKHPIHLTDDEGCVLRPKMMSSFQKTSDTKGAASVIAYSHFYAFKFPETVEVTIQCTVEICRHGCPDTCYQARDGAHGGDIESLAAQGREPPEIPTYKDSHPFTAVITSKPETGNYTSALSFNLTSTSVGGPSNSSSEEKEPLNASPGTHHDFYVNRYPFDLYDLMEAEEREDKGETAYTDEDDYAEKKPIYFPPLSDVFDDEEKGKTFEPNQEIENISVEHESQTTTSTSMPEIQSEYESEEKPEIDSASTPLSIVSTENDLDPVSEEKPEEEPVSSSQPDGIIEVPSSAELKETASQDAFAKSAQEETLNQLFSAELFENDKEDVSTGADDEFTGKSHFELIPQSSDTLKVVTKKESLKESDSLTEVIPKATAEERLYEFNTSILITTAAPSHQNSLLGGTEEIKVLNTNSQKRNLNTENTAVKESHEENSDYYELKFRKPADYKDIKHIENSLHYRPFVPPAPLPPITLYNGLPLYYYNHPRTELEYHNRNDFEFASRLPYKNDYAKSKLRRPGSRRGRRDIGENEQLGLKHTLKVVATTDFEFLIKENEKSENVEGHMGDFDDNICLAPSSFAAGLGLLLLANVCVLCVVVFWGHHYYMHRDKKVKNTELLSTEMS